MAIQKENIISKIREGFAATLQIWIDEIALAIKDPGSLMFFVIAPLFYPLVYSYLYNNEETPDVPMVVVDECNTMQSREFTRMADATKEIKVVGRCISMDEAYKAIAEREAYGVMQIPKDFSRDIQRTKQTCVKPYCDMTSFMYYKALMMGLNMTSLEMNAKIKTKMIAGKTEREQELNAAPLKYEQVSLFNTQNGYGSYLVPGVLVLIVQQMLLLGVGMAAGTMRDHNGGRRLIASDDYCRGTLRNVIGKSACYIMIWIVGALFLFLIVPRLFTFPQLMKVGDSFAFIVPYVLACVFFAMTMSLIITERESVFVVFVFTSVIFIFASGMSWPWSSMSSGWQMVSKILPSTLGIQTFLSLNTMGCSLSDAAPMIVGLWTQAGIYFITTCILYRLEIRKTFKNID